MTEMRAVVELIDRRGCTKKIECFDLKKGENLRITWCKPQ